MNGAISTQQFQAATQEDSILQKAISYMHSQRPVRKSLQGDRQGLYDINNELSIRNGLLYRSDQLVVPESLRPTILQHAHEGQSVFVREGYPNHIVTDNGVQFTSHKIKDYFAERGIKHSTTALYHPQGNGLVERINRTIKEGIQLATLQHKDPVLATKERLFVYHTTPHSMTEKTPFELMRGRVA